MKRYFTFLLFVCACMMSFAQNNYKVSTEQGKKNVVLEKFTGINCGYCADGHIKADRIKKANPGRVFLVNIHEGHMAAPHKGQDDLRTEDGDDIARLFPPKGYPSGMVNRQKIDQDKAVTGRENWNGMATSQLNLDASMNIYVDAVYDGNTDSINVHVEGYALKDFSNKDLKMHVMLTQDHIISYQNGFTDPEDYPHMDVLRACVTDVRGDIIKNFAKGSYFTKEYRYKTPEIIGNISFNLEDINVVAFVTSDDIFDVENAAGSKLRIENYKKDPKGELFEPLIPINRKYGYNFFEAKVKNISGEQLTKATFLVSVNGKKTTSVAECNIAPFETGMVTIPYERKFDANGMINYSLTLTGINDHEVKTNYLNGMFSEPKKTDGRIEVEITTDRSAADNEFMLKDEDGNVIKTFGPYENGEHKTYTENLVLEENKTYCIEITDKFGNGMKAGSPGSLITRTEDGKTIDNFKEINGYGIRSFFTVENTLSIDKIEINGSGSDRTFSLSGVEINKNDKSERIVIRNGKKYINR